MEITEVRIKLMDDPGDRLQGFCSITFNGCFVIRDLKIILGGKGPFVAMPSRKLTDRCPECGTKNHLRAKFCNECGAELEEDRAVKDDEGRAKLYADIAHPINSGCRDLIQRKVLEAFEREKVLAKQSGYVCTYDDYGEDRVARLKVKPNQSDSRGMHYRIDSAHPQYSPTSSSSVDGDPPHHLERRPHEQRELQEESGRDRESFGEGV